MLYLQTQCNQDSIQLVFDFDLPFVRYLTAEQNVQMGADLLPNLGYRARRDQAREWLRSVGLEDELGKLPHDLSGAKSREWRSPEPLQPNLSSY